MSSVVEVTQDGSVRVLSIDNPPVNGLGAAVRRALAEELEKALEDEGVEAIVLAGKGKLFCAGADIREFGKEPPPDIPHLPDVIDALEASTKPVQVGMLNCGYSRNSCTEFAGRIRLYAKLCVTSRNGGVHCRYYFPVMA